MPEVRKAAGKPEVGTLELRAYHAINKEPCVDQVFDELMLWGSSKQIDLTDLALQEVTVNYECRPSCNCSELDTDPSNCPHLQNRSPKTCRHNLLNCLR